MSSNLSRSCIFLNETRPSFKLPPDRSSVLKDVLAYLGAGFLFIFLWGCFVVLGRERSWKEIASSTSIMRVEVMRSKLTKLLLGETIWQKLMILWGRFFHNTSIRNSYALQDQNQHKMYPPELDAHKTHSSFTNSWTWLVSPACASQHDSTANAP